MRYTRYGRCLFYVTSRSRKGLRHLLDIEKNTHGEYHCECEDAEYRHRPCGHVRYMVGRILSKPEKFMPEEVERAKIVQQLIRFDEPEVSDKPQEKKRTYILK